MTWPVVATFSQSGPEIFVNVSGLVVGIDGEAGYVLVVRLARRRIRQKDRILSPVRILVALRDRDDHIDIRAGG